MKINSESIRDQAIGAVGNLIGSAAGALAGPKGIAVGGAIGSVGALIAAKSVPKYFSLDPFRRFLNNKKVMQLLHNKINEDLDGSFLDCQATFDRTLSSMREVLSMAAKQDRMIGTLDKRIQRGFKWKLRTCVKGDPEFQRCLGELACFCQKHGSIKIATSAVCAAAIAILDDLTAEYGKQPGVSVSTSFHPINGRRLFESLLSECDVHFSIGNLEALMLALKQARFKKPRPSS